VTDLGEVNALGDALGEGDVSLERVRLGFGGELADDFVDFWTEEGRFVTFPELGGDGGDALSELTLDNSSRSNEVISSYW